jgi:menaquinol-cytochrome c reductase iron-sulfur subunit
LSKHATGASEGAQRKIFSAYDDPGTAEEISRRSFMANATLAIGGLVGLGLAIPIIGSLVPQGGSSTGTWSPLTADELKSLEAATDKPVKLTFSMSTKDSYLPQQTSDQYVWGIKVTDQSKFVKLRTPDLFPTGNAEHADVPYSVFNMSFVIFSPICPHLGCQPVWNADASRFQCPCHGSQFGLDGEHLAGPAPRGLDPLPFKEQNGTANVMWIRYKASVPDRVVISYT